jgi:HPt (histidine-containing phosphotransfer) domain-containing protein
MMNKPKLYEKILCEFHNRYCEEGAKIRAAIATGNFEVAERRAHSTKGLSGSIGALSLMAIAGALEASLHACHAPSEEILQTFENELNIVVEGIRAGFGLSTPNTN